MSSVLADFSYCRNTVLSTYGVTSPYPRNLGLLLITVFIGTPVLEHPHTLVLLSSMILPSDLCLGFPSGLFLLAFLSFFLLYPMCDRYMFCPLHSLDFCHPNNV